jgi:HSP20 family protein
MSKKEHVQEIAYKSWVAGRPCNEMARADLLNRLVDQGVVVMKEQAQNTPAKSGQNNAPARTGGSAEWTPFESLRREVDRLFDDFHPFGRWPSIRRMTGSGHSSWPVAPAMDLVERDNEYEITAELPGIDEKDVELKLANRTLTIKGEKTEQKEEKEKDYYLSERRFGSFQRSFQLPEGVDQDKIEAHFSKGVLTVKVPKAAGAQSSEKKIDIKAK